ncbi:MAG: acetyl-CoA carboxylase biotin carboxyl carrier protein [Hyphomicrobiales bacterium]|nr:acetyl-CoA carboxylase biotin carboxyl carrier protein [Hyphomicrobiales bacterium]
MKSRLQVLAQILEEKNLQEIEVSFWGLRFRMVRERESGGQIVMPMSVPSAPQAASAPPPPADTPPSPASSDASDHPGVVPSPMVGVVYLAPEPNAKPFVSVGEQVKEGQTLLIIEAMKTMNMISAPRSGTFSRLLVENGQAVEYGEPLLIIE